MMSPDDQALRARLTTLYRQLPKLEQKAIQVLSVLYEPTLITDFMDSFHATGGRDEANQLFTLKALCLK